MMQSSLVSGEYELRNNFQHRLDAALSTPPRRYQTTWDMAVPSQSARSQGRPVTRDYTPQTKGWIGIAQSLYRSLLATKHPFPDMITRSKWIHDAWSRSNGDVGLNYTLTPAIKSLVCFSLFYPIFYVYFNTYGYRYGSRHQILVRSWRGLHAESCLNTMAWTRVVKRKKTKNSCRVCFPTTRLCIRYGTILCYTISHKAFLGSKWLSTRLWQEQDCQNHA
jgi:hypothetical protein